MDDGWADLVHDLTLDLLAVECGQFVIVQHCDGLDPNPYVQAAPDGAGGWYCEVVSGHYLPTTVWPIDEWYLLAADWTPPVNPQDNWSRTVDSPTMAAQILADGLRHGRRCVDWQPIIWQTARFPRPPDDERDDPPVAPPPRQPGAGCRVAPEPGRSGRERPAISATVAVQPSSRRFPARSTCCRRSGAPRLTQLGRSSRARASGVGP